jgi:hypothetical protein
MVDGVTPDAPQRGPLTWAFLQGLEFLPLSEAEARVRALGYTPEAVPETVEIRPGRHGRPGVVLLSHEEDGTRRVRCAHAGDPWEVAG